MNPRGIEDMSDAELAQWGIARKPATPEVTSGRISSHSAGDPASVPGQPLSLFGQTYERALPRVLSLGEPISAYSPAQADSRFPPGDFEYAGGVFQARSFIAGFLGTAAWQANTGERYAAAVLTYGSGASSHRVVFDWRPGTYNLPPCEAVSLSVLPYGSGWAGAGNVFTFVASCSPGSVQDAHVPTVTGAGLVQAEARVAVPSRARMVDAYVVGAIPGAAGYVTAVQGSGHTLLRDYANSVFYPMGPAPAEPGDLFVDVGGEASGFTVGLKFWLSL